MYVRDRRGAHAASTATAVAPRHGPAAHVVVPLLHPTGQSMRHRPYRRVVGAIPVRTVDDHRSRCGDHLLPFWTRDVIPICTAFFAFTRAISITFPFRRGFPGLSRLCRVLTRSSWRTIARIHLALRHPLVAHPSPLVPMQYAGSADAGAAHTRHRVHRRVLGDRVLVCSDSCGDRQPHHVIRRRVQDRRLPRRRVHAAGAVGARRGACRPRHHVVSRHGPAPRHAVPVRDQGRQRRGRRPRGRVLRSTVDEGPTHDRHGTSLVSHCGGAVSNTVVGRLLIVSRGVGAGLHIAPP